MLKHRPFLINGRERRFTGTFEERDTGTHNYFFLPPSIGFNLGPKDIKERPTLTYHRMIEAFNFAAARLTYLTDPDFSNKTNLVGVQVHLAQFEETSRKEVPLNYSDEYKGEETQITHLIQLKVNQNQSIPEDCGAKPAAHLRKELSKLPREAIGAAVRKISVVFDV